MSFVIATPENLAAAVSDLAGIGRSVGAANSAAAAWTTSVLPAAGDEVSAAIAGLFGTFAAEYQAVSAQAAGFHAQFVRALTSAGGAYAAAEAANVSPLGAVERAVLDAVNGPVRLLTGRPLIGDQWRVSTPAGP
ncbi:hypothetical protein AWC15_13155 [Mycobacterium lacus]|uniref:Uncharacterized protein n=1 Tax=Mycobacterium lacus TaxID=169765 RepID=A0A1X1YTT2_9MYCO|nr:PE family protein [Mycobacterium lacus]MCV7124958.1 PE family protein [Mycobacterium lacus]ORW14433.1 hypothetical protein AWC15_13155 [Mycobacterium lacus]BBX95834.1 hypothetical protein MLAC_11280 [Mycobacterium lacus]